jgi:hypothetical protein
VSLSALALLAAATAYAGFQWTIRSLVYPQFGSVRAADFAQYERDHQRRVSVTVAPLFLALIAATAGVAIWVPAGRSRWLVGLAIALLIAILASTALLAVPLHRRLSHGFDARAHRQLLVVDTLRLVAALGEVGTALALAR